jgi:hypothetical protein
VAILGVLMQQGALAASFAVSGTNFTVTAKELDGTGFAQFGSIDRLSNGKVVPVAISGISSAKIYDMCQLVTQQVPILGTVYMKLTAGTGSSPVQATNLVLDVNNLNADATFTNIQIGNDASTLTEGGVTGQAGLFGQQSQAVVLKNVSQTAYATTAGSFSLPGLSLSVSTSPTSC